MRELTVYYCSKCGRYGFYQVSKNAELEKTIDWMHDMIWDLTRKLHGNANE